MSVIGKVPFIETLIESLTDEQKEDLLDLVNSVKEQAFRSLIDDNYAFEVDDTMLAVFLQVAPSKNICGIAIRTDDYEVLLNYGSTQNINIYEFDSANRTYAKINEECDINELRRVLGIDTIPVPTDVVANPTLAGTESALTSLQVGDTKYKVDEKITTISFNPTRVVYDDISFKATFTYTGGTEVTKIVRQYKDIKITFLIQAAGLTLTTKALGMTSSDNNTYDFYLQQVAGNVLDSIEMDIKYTERKISITLNCISEVYDQMKLLIPSSVLVLQASLLPAL